MMTRFHRFAKRTAPSVVAAGLVLGLATAQVPQGAVVASAIKALSAFPGDGGLYVADPRAPGPLSPVTGLPESITYASYTGPGAVGANCVLIEPRSGDLLVGVNGIAGETIDLHRVTLDGLHATAVQRFTLGTLVANGGGVFEMDWIDGDEVVAAVGAIAGPAGTPATVQVARIDLTTGAVAPVDVGSAPAGFFINAIAYDAPADRLYVGISGGSPRTTRILLASLQSPGSHVTLASMPGSVRNFSLDASGDLIVALGVAAPGTGPSLVRVDPAGVVTDVLTGFDTANALAIEPATGQYFVAGQPDVTVGPRTGLWFVPADGATAPTLLGDALSTRAGIAPISGLDVARNPAAYGGPSGRRAYAWSDEPDPRRFPAAGGDFFATVAWPVDARPVVGGFLVSLAPGDCRLGPVDLLVDPRAVVFAGAAVLDPTGRRSVVSFPVAAGVAGATLHVQTFHVGRGGPSATPGLRARVW